MRLNRRRFLKYAGATAAVTYGFSRFPIVFGQEGSNEIDCGTVVTVPTFTGVVDKSWLGDTNDYKAFGQTQFPNQSDQYQMEGHLRTKFNDYTWFATEFPAIPVVYQNPELMFIWDINPGKNEEYNLVLKWGPNGIFEADHTQDDSTPPQIFYYEGTSLYKVFHRGVDYDWKYAFAPSETYSKPHPQFNVKIRTDILTKYSKIIDFAPTFIGYGSIDWFSGMGRFNYVQQALPEFGLKEAVAATALGAGLIAAKIVKSKKEWSRREFLRFPKAVTESL
jgi:hypothetical protein